MSNVPSGRKPGGGGRGGLGGGGGGGGPVRNVLNRVLNHVLNHVLNRVLNRVLNHVLNHKSLVFCVVEVPPARRRQPPLVSAHGFNRWGAFGAGDFIRGLAGGFNQVQTMGTARARGA